MDESNFELSKPFDSLALDMRFARVGSFNLLQIVQWFDKRQTALSLNAPNQSKSHCFVDAAIPFSKNQIVLESNNVFIVYSTDLTTYRTQCGHLLGPFLQKDSRAFSRKELDKQYG